MILPTDDERRRVTDLLQQKPFECNHVFFFSLQEERPVPLDSDSEKLYQRDHEIVDALPYCEALEGWAGNIVDGPREEARAYFYASYRFDDFMVVVSKVVGIPPGVARVESPFNKYFVDAIAASIAPVLGEMPSRLAALGGHNLPEGKRLIPFNELAAWRQCKDLWREKLGADVWIAVKGTQPIATARTVEELDQKVRGAEPPLFYAPPKGEETACDIISTSERSSQAKTGGSKP